MNQAGEIAPGVVSKSGFAALHGVSPAAVSKMIRVGRLAAPALLPSGKINVALAKAQLGDAAPNPTRAESQSAEKAQSGAEPQTSEYARSRARREAAAAETAELLLAETKGRLVDRDAVDRAVEGQIRALRNRILLVPRDIAAACARLGDEIAIEAAIGRALRAVLTASADAARHD